MEAQGAIQRCFLITAFRLTTPATSNPAAVRGAGDVACWARWGRSLEGARPCSPCHCNATMAQYLRSLCAAAAWLPAQASAIVADLLAAAEQQQLHWRYRCLAECALCMLLPLLDAASGTAVARHWAGVAAIF